MTEPATDTIDVEEQADQFDEGFGEETDTDSGLNTGTVGKPESETKTDKQDKIPTEPETTEAKPKKAKEAQPDDADGKLTLEQKAQARAELQQYQTSEKRFWSELTQKLPDVLQTVKTPEFQEWLGQQSERVKAMANQNESVDEALTVMKMFNDKPKPESKKAQQIAQSLDDEFFKGLKVKTADGEKSFEDFVGEYDEVALMIKAGLENVYSRLAGQLGNTGNDKSEEIQKIIDGLSGQVGNLSFWQEVQQQHSDARQILNSNEYKEWLGKQNKLVQNYANSKEAEAVVEILDAYKADSLNKKASGLKASQSENHKKISNVIKSSLKGSATGGDKGDISDEDDFDAGFNG